MIHICLTTPRLMCYMFEVGSVVAEAGPGGGGLSGAGAGRGEERGGVPLPPPAIADCSGPCGQTEAR